MSPRRISTTAVAVLVALTFVVGCSSSDGSDGADAKTTTTAAKGADDGSTTTAAGDDSPDTTAGGDDLPSTTSGGGVELSGDFCDKAKQLENVGDDIFGGTTTDTSPDALLASIQKLFRTLDDVYGQLAQDPPAEIADEIDLLAKFASTNYDKVKGMDNYEDAAKVAQSAFGQDTESKEFQDASDKIGAYVEKECGIKAG